MTTHTTTTDADLSAQQISGVGQLRLRPVDPDADAALLHGWTTHDKARFWEPTPADVEGTRAVYQAIAARPGHDAFIGEHDGRPAFLVERYDPRQDAVGSTYRVQDGDVGMHVLVAPSGEPVAGFTRAVFAVVLDWLFADPATVRVVVEPDVRNDAVRRLNAQAGFVVHREVELPGKRAALSACTRADYGRARPSLLRPGPVHHLTPQRWDAANRTLVAKALGEFAHELLVRPEPLPDNRFEVVADDGRACYRFTARRYALDHWLVDAASLEYWDADGEPAPPDALRLVTDLRTSLQLSAEILPVYLEELTSTLASAAFKLGPERPGSRQLAGERFQVVEAAMTEGHPCFVACNGRLGLSAQDFLAYAPEVGRPIRLTWLAARRDLTTLALSTDLTEDALLDAELDERVRADFHRRLTELGLDAAGYVLVPVHPWQWENRIAVTFAADLARRDLVHLGDSQDEYQAQQSIRTFANLTRPERHYVKTAMSVLNMGFLRGLSAKYMAATPAINDWLHGLVQSDDELGARRFSVLRERAAVGYLGGASAQAAPSGSPYRKMLAALWRESAVPRVAEGEHVMTMAALLHVDGHGRSLAAELVARSGLDPRDWLRRYLQAYLVPVVHLLYRHDVALMPHGENIILVLRDGVVDRVLLKDIGEEVLVVTLDRELPADVGRIQFDVPAELRPLSVLTDVVDSFLRFLGARLDASGTLPEREFWSVAAQVLAEYQQRHPDVAGAVEELFAPEFARSCLNRLQLRKNDEMVDLEDPAYSLCLEGTLVNPLARWRGVPGSGGRESSGRESTGRSAVLAGG
ncbi:GNAT family N-acetyltransferase [Angustibacter luteus]|uniref:Lysine N-acyltransferase MbtK n=1 Tax=Angustibacter luteus TaxID=658456 RepID=A0ABW1JDF7_9ACTN